MTADDTTLRSLLPADVLFRLSALRRAQGWSEAVIAVRLDHAIFGEMPLERMQNFALCNAETKDCRCLQAKGHSGSHEGVKAGRKQPKRWANNAGE